MRSLLAPALALATLGLLVPKAEADKISVSVLPNVNTTTSNGEQSSIGSIWGTKAYDSTLNVSADGSASLNIPIVGYMGSNGSGATDDIKYPISASFSALIGTLTPGSSDEYRGPGILIQGSATGTIEGPGYGGTYWRWSGGYSGTATSVSLDWAGSQDVSLLPAVLQDALKHPDHVHYSVYVSGGSANYLTLNVNFDAPSSSEVPEPGALVTVVAGLGMLIGKRHRAAASRRP
ncbi:hypothetical protein [Aquisphaera insulae]|uniref:hypothetical protein n=1 Tax=Aquisphaera insulae TaxID=2712864 RepID=UPI0013E9DE09|nr:hypothetical protein [Aquisphaera insulae]